MAQGNRSTSQVVIVSVVLVLIAAVAVTLITSLHSKGARPVVGEPIQDFTAVDSQGVTFTLSEEYAKGPVVLIFYRGFWCGICQNQLQDLEQIRPDLEALGAQMVAISTDGQALAERARVDLGLGYRVIPDDRLKLLRLFDHAETYSNDDIFHPAVYVIDQEGIVRWGYFGDDAADRPPTDEVYRAVLELVRAADAGPTPAETES